MAARSGVVAGARGIGCALALVVPGCSIVLDWDPRIDAGPDPAACAFKEPNDDLANAQLLAPLETGPAAICVPGDHDFYRFHVDADGQNVTISVQFDLATSQDLDFQVYDPSMFNTVIARGLSFVSPEVVTCPGTNPSCPQLVTGDYIVEVFGASAAVTNTYTISIGIAPP